VLASCTSSGHGPRSNIRVCAALFFYTIRAFLYTIRTIFYHIRALFYHIRVSFYHIRALFAIFYTSRAFAGELDLLNLTARTSSISHATNKVHTSYIDHRLITSLRIELTSGSASVSHSGVWVRLFPDPVLVSPGHVSLS